MRLGRNGSRWMVRLGFLIAIVGLGGSSGCAFGENLLYQVFNFSSLGGDIAGRRANLKIKFVNNTPYVPICTFGTYDPLNDNRNPDLDFPIKFDQFVFDDSQGGIRLNGFSESDVITWAAQAVGDPGGCGRAISLGGEQFIQRIEDDPTLADTARPEALRPLCNEQTNQPTYGIAFYPETSTGPADNACDSKSEIVAYAEPLHIVQGVQIISLGGQFFYPCDGTSTVVVTFVEDTTQPGGIRIDLSLEPGATQQ